jgi:hypothetical protein
MNSKKLTVTFYLPDDAGHETTVHLFQELSKLPYSWTLHSEKESTDEEIPPDGNLPNIAFIADHRNR